MAYISEEVKKADWKSEKHVPVIECEDRVNPGYPAAVKVTVGKAVAHPNTTAHHIRWIDLYFTTEDTEVPVHLGRFEFAAHGESTEGADKGPAYMHHQVQTSVTLTKSGKLQAMACCNIHGLWESRRDITVK